MVVDAFVFVEVEEGELCVGILSARVEGKEK